MELFVYLLTILISKINSFPYYYNPSFKDEESLYNIDYIKSLSSLGNEQLTKFFLFDYFMFNGEVKKNSENNIPGVCQSINNIYCKDLTLKRIKNKSILINLKHSSECSNLIEKIQCLSDCSPLNEYFTNRNNKTETINISKYTCINFINTCLKLPNYDNYENICIEKLSEFIHNKITLSEVQNETIFINNNNCYYSDKNNIIDNNLYQYIRTKYFENDFENYDDNYILSRDYYLSKNEYIENVIQIIFGKNKLKTNIEVSIKDTLSFILDYSIVFSNIFRNKRKNFSIFEFCLKAFYNFINYSDINFFFATDLKNYQVI